MTSIENFMDFDSCVTEAALPIPRDYRIGWLDTHKDHVKVAKTSNSKIIIIGDSIAYGLTRYSNIWHKYFPNQSALNFGIPGDHTENILWRLQNIKLPGSLKYAIILAGTNNLNHDTPENIANAILIMAYFLLQEHPNIKVIVSGLLPRDNPRSGKRKDINEINGMLRKG